MFSLWVSSTQRNEDPFDIDEITKTNMHQAIDSVKPIRKQELHHYARSINHHQQKTTAAHFDLVKFPRMPFRLRHVA